MKDKSKSKSQLVQELGALRKRLAKLEKLGRTQAVHGREAGMLPQSSGFHMALNKLKPNDHLCLIYDSPQEWRAAVIPFIKTGLKRDEKCICILGTHTADRLRSCLHEEDVNVADAETSGKLLVVYQTNAWSRAGSFDPDQVIALLIAEADKAIDEGYSAIRMTEEVGSACEGRLTPERLLEYEAKLNRDFFTRCPCTAICQYDRWKCDPEVIKNAIMTHPLLLRNREIHQNFYYIPPEEFLSQRRAEHEIQDMLASIEQEGETQKRIRFLSNALQRSSQPFSASYPDGHIMYCNPAFCTLSGYSEEELRTMTWIADLTPPEWRELERSVLKKLYRTGEPRRYEKELIRKDGSRCPTEVFLHEVCDGERNVQYHYRFISDITERKRREKLLRESEERFRTFFENGPAYCYMISPDGKILNINVSALKALGYKKEEILGKPLLTTIYAPSSRKRARGLFMDWKKTGKLRNEEVNIITKTGEERVVLLSADAVRNANGELLQSISVQLDITERKRVEERLREREERYRDLVEQERDVIYTMDIQGNITSANSAVKIWGYQPEELSGRNFVSLIPEDWVEKTVKDFEDLLKRGKIVAETVLLDKKGEPHFAEYSSSVIKKDKEVVGVRGIIRDITDRKRTEEELRKERDKAIATVRELSS